MAADLEKLQKALRQYDRQALEDYVRRLEHESLFPKDKSPEYASKLDSFLRLAHRALQDKVRTERQAKPATLKHSRRRWRKKRSDPPISSADKYDPRGRAPFVAVPKEKDRSVMKVPPRKERK